QVTSRFLPRMANQLCRGSPGHRQRRSGTATAVYCRDSTAWRPPVRPDDLELLVTRQMPYGNYKGRLIADLPGHYLNWFAREGFPAGETGRLLQLMQEIDHNGLSAVLEPLRRRPGVRPQQPQK